MYTDNAWAIIQTTWKYQEADNLMHSEIPAQRNNAGVASQLLIVKMPHKGGYSF